MPALSFESSVTSSVSLIATGIVWPSSAASAVLIATATCPGPLPAEVHFRPWLPYCAQSLRKPFSVSPPNGTKGCFASSIARTTPVSPPCADIPSKWPCTAIASATAFCATPSSHLPYTWTVSHFLPVAVIVLWKPLCRSVSTDVPATPRTSSTLPPFGRWPASHLAHSTPSPYWSTSTLIASSLSSVLSNATSTTPAFFARRIAGPNEEGFCASTMIAS